MTDVRMERQWAKYIAKIQKARIIWLSNQEENEDQAKN